MRITICDKLLSGKSTIRNITVILVTIRDYNKENYYQVSPPYMAHSIFYSSFMATYFIRQDSNKSYYLELILINNFLQTQIVIWFQKAFPFLRTTFRLIYLLHDFFFVHRHTLSTVP